MNSLFAPLRPYLGRLGLSRSKKTSSYHKKKMSKKMAKALHNPKYFETSKHSKMQVGIAGASSNFSAAHLEQRRTLSLLGTQYKHDLYGILQSGRYGSQLAALSFSKMNISADSKELQVYWQRTGNDAKDSTLEKKIDLVTDLIQSDFEELYPDLTLPILKFQSELNVPMQMELLIEGLDIGRDEDADDVFTSSRLPPLVFIQDVYQLDRSAILHKLYSASPTKTSFGVNEKYLE